MTDQEIRCADCSTFFIHSVRDQEFYIEQGYSVPKRCKRCRAIKKRERDGRGSQSQRQY